MVLLSRYCYEVIQDSSPDGARSLTGFRCETFESLIAEMMGPSNWQKLLGEMISRKLEGLQSQA